MDFDISGFALIPNTQASATEGSFDTTIGYFVSRGSMIGGSVTGVFQQNSQDIFLSGGYRYYFRTGNSRFLPYVGASAGGNIIHIFGLTDTRFLATGGAGIRYFVARHVALDIGYTLDYVHVAGLGFGDSTLSAITVGFAHVWRGR